MTTASKRMIRPAISLKIFWSNFRCIKMASTKMDFVVASKRATAVDQVVSSIWVTATETEVNTNKSNRINPYVRYGII